MVEDLHELHLRGATLIIEHLEFRRTLEPDCWLRTEVHRVVGHAPEEWVLQCDGPHDHSDLKGPPDDDDHDCRLCRAHQIHTKALHVKLSAQSDSGDWTLEL